MLTVARDQHIVARVRLNLLVHRYGRRLDSRVGQDHGRSQGARAHPVTGNRLNGLGSFPETGYAEMYCRYVSWKSGI